MAVQRMAGQSGSHSCPSVFSLREAPVHRIIFLCSRLLPPERRLSIKERSFRFGEPLPFRRFLRRDGCAIFAPSCASAAALAAGEKIRYAIFKERKPVLLCSAFWGECGCNKPSFFIPPLPFRVWTGSKTVTGYRERGCPQSIKKII